MLTLGISIGSAKSEFRECGDDGFDGHDTAAVLLDDGRIVAAVEEERLSRIKHTNYMPWRSVRWVLEFAGVGLADVDAIAVPFSELESTIDGMRSALTSSATYSNGRDMLADELRAAFCLEGDIAAKLRFCTHHGAHAWSAFYPSGFEEALVITIDGAGGDGLGGRACVTISTATRGRGIETLALLPAELSLGNYYTFFSTLLGYHRFDEYKVMGLAPYGDPAVFRPFFSRCYELLDDGAYSLKSFQEIAMIMLQEGMLAGARKKHQPFTQAHKDYAAALQEWLEVVATHMISHYREVTGLRQLCLAGGVAHNCSFNGKLLYSGMFDKMFVQPAAHDAGCAYGAGIAALVDAKKSAKPVGMPHLSFGPGLPDAEQIAAVVAKWSDLLTCERVPNIEQRAAALLANDEVIGWVQGRAEFGPRALGNRSILADPRPAENKARINAMVKKREGYRPFAPSVTEERLHEIFDVPEGVATFEHMIYALRVKEAYRPVLGAVTHVDGTARVQTVAREHNPRYWTLIREFERLSDVAVVLNTSFNNNAEPIVTSVEDAIACFLTTAIDALVIDDFLIRKTEQASNPMALLKLGARLPGGRRLIRSDMDSPDDEAPHFALESTTTDRFLAKHIEISRELYDVLATRGDPSRGASIAAAAPQGADLEQLAGEVADLWQRRALVLAPVDPA